MLSKNPRYNPPARNGSQPFQSYKPKETEKPQALAKMARTPSGLVEVLCEEIDRMRQGKTTARNANAVAKLARTVVDTVALELEIHKFRSRQPEQVPLPVDYPMGFGGEDYPAQLEHEEEEQTE